MATIQTSIFSPTCASQFCHSAAARSGDLVLEAGVSHDQLVGVLSFNPAARTAGLLRVNPAHPNDSFLLIKLQGPSADQGVRMPNGLPPLSADQIQLIRDWITAGAQP